MGDSNYSTGVVILSVTVLVLVFTVLIGTFVYVYRSNQKRRDSAYLRKESAKLSPKKKAKNLDNSANNLNCDNTQKVAKFKLNIEK